MINFVKQYRQKLNLTQTDLANMLSVSRQTIHAIETNKYIPSTILALKMANVFKTKVESIFQLQVNE